MFGKSLICFLAVFLTTISVVHTLDHDKLLEQYISVCGMKLCNSSMFKIKPKMDYISSCPDCKCDDDCWVNKNCCPDVYLSFPVMTKIRTNVYPMLNGSSEDTYEEMVSTCPNQNHSCEVGPTLSDLFDNVPVFAGPYSLPFRSACYARCNGYTVTRNWYLDIDCDSFYDLNFCSSFLEVSTVLYNAKCTVKYSQNLFKENLPTTKAVVKTCNVTGFWTNYDADVDNLCSYVGPEMGRYSRTHSNVFCYICNPSEPFSSNSIATCNVTGKWNVFDQGLNDACEHYPFAHSEQPYKNWFCRMCNQNNMDPSTIDLVNGSIKLKYKTVADWNLKPSQQYDVTVQDVDIENVVKAFKQKLENISKVTFKSKLERILENGGEFIVNGNTVNITNLLYNVYLRTGSYDICASSLLNVIFTQRSNNCSCDVSCIFNDTDACCPDVRLLTETKCIDQFELSTTSPDENASKWLVISECPANYTNDVIVHLCQSNDLEDAYQSVPVESKTSKMAFKNIYCAFCHLNQDMADSSDVLMTKVQFHTLRLVCPLPIPFQNEISLERIISRARIGQCFIQYLPANIKITCNQKEGRRGQCNRVNLWKNNDADVKWACENTDIFPPYKDNTTIYCDICNPSVNSPPPFFVCNITQRWQIYNPELAMACASYPAMQKTFPYKNGLCKRCNDPNWSRTFTKNSLKAGTTKAVFDLDGYTDRKITLRSFFTTYNDPPRDVVVPIKCQRHQIYDTWKCNPGRRLYNDTCRPLLQTTTNLSYSLSLGLQTQINRSGVYITQLLDRLRIDVRTHLSKILRVKFGNITLSSFMAMSHIACPNRYSTLEHGEKLDILFSSQFEIDTEFVNRFETEKNLVEMPGQTMNVRYLNKVLSFQMSTDPQAFTLPILIRKTSLIHKCYIKQTSPSQFSPHRSFRRSHVSELLQCKQIYLNADEYTIDEDGMTLTFAGRDATVKYPEFELISNGQVRICAHELPATDYEETVENELENALRIFTLILICVSLVCLLITLVPYVKFDYLRTLPGLNTVGLMASLFLVQLLFIIQTFTTTENEAACTLSGIMMHVLWLVYFGWTGVGTFHMYRLFVSDDYFSDDTRRYTTLRRYAMFTVCFALGVATLNLVLTAAITAGDSVGYGGNICFISTLTGKVLAFIVPVIIIFIWNTVFFVVTYRYIHDQNLLCRKVLKDKTVAKDGRSSLQIFLKMFIISGFTWILQLIDGFLPLTVFSFIVTFINASQGVLILFIHRKSFKWKKNKRRPGSKFRGSTSIGLRSRTANSTSTTNTNSTAEIVTESFQNQGFNSVEDVPTPNLASRPSIVSFTSTSRIIFNAKIRVECNSINDYEDECDYIGNAVDVSDDIGNDNTTCGYIADKQNEEHHIGGEGVGRDSEFDKAECESLESDGNVNYSTGDEDNGHSLETTTTRTVSEGDIAMSMPDQDYTEV